MCQECFFAGKGGRYKNHKMTHPMQEYCTTVNDNHGSGGGDDDDDDEGKRRQCKDHKMQEYCTEENHQIHTINAIVYTQTKIINALTNQFNCPIEMAFSQV